MVNADETPWKEGKARPWLWVAVTALVTVFRIASSRGSQVIKDLLGEGDGGTLGTDRYAGYAWLDVASRPVCWAHLTRDFRALVDRGGPAAPLGKEALALIHQLFTAWHQFGAGALDRAGLQAAVGTVDAALAVLVHPGQDNPDPQAAGLCRALLRLWSALWTFAEVDGVEPTGGPLGDRRRACTASRRAVAQAPRGHPASARAPRRAPASSSACSPSALPASSTAARCSPTSPTCVPRPNAVSQRRRSCPSRHNPTPPPPELVRGTVPLRVCCRCIISH